MNDSDAVNPSSIIEALEPRRLLSGESDVPPPFELNAVGRRYAVRLFFTDVALDETGFRVQRATAPSQEFTDIGVVPPSAPGQSGGRLVFQDSNVTLGQAYRYRVRTETEHGVSAPAEITVAVSEAPGPVPPAPTNLAATMERGCVVRLTFTDNDNDERGYTVFRQTDLFGDYELIGMVAHTPLGEVGGQLSFEDHSAVCGETYRYRVYNVSEDDGTSVGVDVVVTNVGQGALGAVYYNEPDVTGDPVAPAAPVLLQSIEQSYGKGTPDPRIEPGGFSGVFEGLLQAEYTETYTFHTASAGGVAFRLADPRDGRVLIDFDNLQARRDLPVDGFQDVAGSAALQQGIRYPIQLRFSANGGAAGFRLGWSSPSVPLEVIPGFFLTPLAPEGPKIQGVFVAASGWKPIFLKALADQGMGDAIDGFALAGGSDRSLILPWTGINRIAIAFDRDVHVGLDDLRLQDSSGQTLAVEGFAYDSSRNTAVWTLSHPLSATLLDLRLNADGVHGVADGLQPLDGEATGAFPSGDHRPGGDFHITLRVFPGDVNRSGGAVNAADLVLTRNRIGRSVLVPGAGAYSIFNDVDGSGVVNAADLVLVRNHIGSMSLGQPLLFSLNTAFSNDWTIDDASSADRHRSSSAMRVRS